MIKARSRKRGARRSELRAPCSLLHAIREDWAVSRERRLGRGLEALLGRAWDDPETPQPPRATARRRRHVDDRMTRDEHGQVWLNCDAIERNPYQPRQTFDEAEIADLADSIRTHGILQPLVVRRVPATATS